MMDIEWSLNAGNFITWLLTVGIGAAVLVYFLRRLDRLEAQMHQQASDLIRHLQRCKASTEDTPAEGAGV